MGMKHLVDTHVLLWLLSSPEVIPDTVLSTLASRSNPLLVSAASAMEIATKIRLGKLESAGLVSSLQRRVESLGAEILPISLEHALLAGSMPWDHRDPFDRLLVAQATAEDATLVTVDRVIARLPVPRVLTW